MRLKSFLPFSGASYIRAVTRSEPKSAKSVHFVAPANELYVVDFDELVLQHVGIGALFQTPSLPKGTVHVLAIAARDLREVYRPACPAHFRAANFTPPSKVAGDYVECPAL
jgi:hypothetical protein